MNRRRWSYVLLAILLPLTGACVEVFAPAPTYVAITEIEITNEDDPASLLEVEVHLYDARSGAFLGCSGDADGLAPVDEADVAYLVTGYFGRVPSGDLLTVDDVIGRDLFAVVIEDDHEPCPMPTNEGTFDLITDDLIGESPVFRGEDLDRGVAFGFGDVVWIVIEGIR